jgi:hypothetical protein
MFSLAGTRPFQQAASRELTALDVPPVAAPRLKSND